MKKKILSIVLAAMMVAGVLAGCGGNPGNEASNNANDANNVANDAADAVNNVADSGDKSVGFVTFTTKGDFFQQLADEFVNVMEADGWKASYEDGEINPEKQIQACENYIAMEVDVLICWAVAPEAMDGVIAKCQESGIKFVAFVAETSSYDVVMISDDATLADYAAKLAAKWIDETYADAEDHSVPVAILSCRTADTGVLQADELLKIEEFSTKAKFEIEVACTDETVETGMSAAENLFTTNPDIKVILTPHSNLATGANNYLTSMSSPITDYKDMGIFAINGDDAMAQLIKSSINDECPLRGMVMTGSVGDTANEIKSACNGVLDGSITPGTVIEASTLFVYADTVEEYLSTGTITSVTNADFD